MKWLLIPPLAYFALVVTVYVAQRSLLYLPGQRGASASELEAYGLRHWPDEAGYRGYLRDVPSAETTVVLFHGNAGEAVDRLHYVEALDFLNARLLLVEYPGYGTRTGRPSEATLLADGRETLVRLRQAFPDGPLHVVGESLGAGVAAGVVGSKALAAPRPRIDGLVLLTPWNTLGAVAKHHYRFLPVEWLLKDRFPSARYLDDLEAMKVVVLAERDEVVPARFGEALYEALPAPKTRVLVDGAAHNDWFAQADRRWWRELWSRFDGRP